MSKKYRLIREYPGSLDYGAVVVYSKMFNIYKPIEGGVNIQLTVEKVELYPDHWAEIIETVPLLTTQDGVEIFDGMDYYLVSHSFIMSYCSYHSPTDLTYPLFSTKEAAEDYIKMNKPEFSRKQILELLETLKK